MFQGLPTTPVLGFSVHSWVEEMLWLPEYENSNENKELADKVAEAMSKVNGINFRSLNLKDTHKTSGDSLDWYKGVLKTRYALAVELRGQYFLGRQNGYLLEPNHIIPSGKEFLAGMKVVFEKLIQDSNDQKIPCKDIWKERTCKRIKILGKCWKKKFAKICKKTCGKC